MSYSTILTEGGLLPIDVLDQLVTGDLRGQRPEDFGFEKQRRLNDEIAAAWGDARAYWDSLRRGLRRLKPNEAATRVTREQWMVPLLRTLGYDTLTYMPNAARVDTRTYAISHRAGLNEDAPPIHIEGVGTPIDKRPPSGRPRLSPHALIQEYLNSTEHVWGIVTNGEQLRLLRDSAQISRPRYLEFDLRGMMEGEKFSEFGLLYRLLHRSRLPQTSADSASSWLEQYHQQAIESGGRVREGLRIGVQQALEFLGNGLLQHPANTALRQQLTSGQLSNSDFYRELLRLVYRLLFLMVAEERHLLASETSDPQRLQIYLDHYSLRRLRSLVEQPGVGRAPYDDVWLGLQTTFQLFEGSDETSAAMLGLTPLNGDLFGESAIQHLINTQLRNDHALAALRSLSLYRDEQHKTWRRVNYSAIDVEELGSVYESLLDFRPAIQPLYHDSQLLRFSLAKSTERKTTGSYYTRPELVQELIKSALEPVMAERLSHAKTQQQQVDALLSLTVCDPACGSGHFLLAAARRIGRELAKVRSGEDQPSPAIFQVAVRDVISHCIYGVDLNPLAVDLCKLALWIEGHSAGKPLNFLDAHIQHGNSLVGATADIITNLIPDDAYKPVTGDDKKVASAIKQRNKQERSAWENANAVQNSMFDLAEPDRDPLLAEYVQFEAMPERSVGEIRAKEQRFYQLEAKSARKRTEYNLWTAAFFTPLTSTNLDVIPTSRDLLNWQQGQPVNPKVIGNANGLAAELHFFHFELAFRHVFAKGGFDVILGNPPWERIKLQEQEFFAEHDQAIAEAPNKAARQRLIDQLPKHNPKLAAAFEWAKFGAEAQSRFVRASGLFPLTAVGDMNTYALFSELDRKNINSQGRAGIIVPTGIATDDSTKGFFSDINNHQELISLFDFENREKLFPTVDSRFKFALVTLGKAQKATEFIFFVTNTLQLLDEQRIFELNADEIALLNPNTRTSPIFRTKIDAQLTKKIYQNIPILINDIKKKKSWNCDITRTFDMAKFGTIAKSRFDLEPNYILEDGIYSDKKDVFWIPILESKMFNIFDHRFSTYEDVNKKDLLKGLTTLFTNNESQNSAKKVISRYFLPKNIYLEYTYWNKNNYWIAYRNITNTTNERSMISSILPKMASDYTVRLVFGDDCKGVRAACFSSCINSITFDYIVRQFLAGTNLSDYIMKQLPVLPPETFGEAELAYIVPRVLELVYTAWDMQPFAEDAWNELDAAGRDLVLERQRECNREADSALFSPRDEFVLAPFRWNDERRAQIRAELDALIAKLYGLTRDELRYILDPADVYGSEFPGETFRVLKEREIREYGEYRTQRLVLAAWDELEHRTESIEQRGKVKRQKAEITRMKDEG